MHAYFKIKTSFLHLAILFTILVKVRNETLRYWNENKNENESHIQDANYIPTYTDVQCKKILQLTTCVFGIRLQGTAWLEVCSVQFEIDLYANQQSILFA